MIRVELDKNSPLVLGSSTPTGQSCPVGQGAPMFVPAWACLDVLCRTLHGSIEKITSEVFVLGLRLRSSKVIVLGVR